MRIRVLPCAFAMATAIAPTIAHAGDCCAGPPLLPAYPALVGAVPHVPMIVAPIEPAAIEPVPLYFLNQGAPGFRPRLGDPDDSYPYASVLPVVHHYAYIVSSGFGRRYGYRAVPHRSRWHVIHVPPG